MKLSAIIFDLDGTLCDDSHRQPIITQNKGKMTDDLWHQYHSKCLDDPPFEVVCDCLRALSKKHHIAIMTGRDEKFRVQTLSWLYSLSLATSVDTLYMRPDGNKDSSVTLKYDIYNSYIKDVFDVKCVFEDRKCVVDMWRSLGLMCLQTKEGNY